MLQPLWQHPACGPATYCPAARHAGDSTACLPYSLFVTLKALLPTPPPEVARRMREGSGHTGHESRGLRKGWGSLKQRGALLTAGHRRGAFVG